MHKSCLTLEVFLILVKITNCIIFKSLFLYLLLFKKPTPTPTKKSGSVLKTETANNKLLDRVIIAWYKLETTGELTLPG